MLVFLLAVPCVDARNDGDERQRQSARVEKEKETRRMGKERKRVYIAFCLLFFAVLRQSFPKKQTQTDDCSFARSADVYVLDPSFSLLLLLQMLVILLSLSHLD